MQTQPPVVVCADRPNPPLWATAGAGAVPRGESLPPALHADARGAARPSQGGTVRGTHATPSKSGTLTPRPIGASRRGPCAEHARSWHACSVCSAKTSRPTSTKSERSTWSANSTPTWRTRRYASSTNGLRKGVRCSLSPPTSFMFSPAAAAAVVLQERLSNMESRLVGVSAEVGKALTLERMPRRVPVLRSQWTALRGINLTMARRAPRRALGRCKGRA